LVTWRISFVKVANAFKNAVQENGQSFSWIGMDSAIDAIKDSDMNL
jgi:hypothetical protein